MTDRTSRVVRITTSPSLRMPDGSVLNTTHHAAHRAMDTLGVDWILHRLHNMIRVYAHAGVETHRVHCKGGYNAAMIVSAPITDAQWDKIEETLSGVHTWQGDVLLVNSTRQHAPMVRPATLRAAVSIGNGLSPGWNLEKVWPVIVGPNGDEVLWRVRHVARKA